MGRRKKIGFSIEEVIRFSNYLKVEKPFCPLLISVILLGWAVESSRWKRGSILERRPHRRGWSEANPIPLGCPLSRVFPEISSTTTLL
ncbi:hypothetical protein CDL15_Pgr006537 [Punica granatum]|uniref:Uncharacterized protein n=1 Tax=Punica granatum TaxID=22663 RepID=A0A218XZZ3_PUNGR|nr:hypothetical protein CDL15_Pgr006537 [Punica granatum]